MMPYKTDAISELSSCVRRVCGAKDFDSVQKIRKSLKRRMKELRNHYMLANGSEDRRPVDEWLCDNYYVIEKESKQSLKEIRQLAQKGASGLALLYAVVEAALTSCMPPISDDSVRMILGELQKDALISEKQFSFMPCAIKLSLVGIAHKACMHTGSADEIAYAITGISKLSSLDFERIVEVCSTVEKTLLCDPAGIYENMSQDSRHYYRRLVAVIAAKSGRGESETAKEMLELAKSGKTAEQKHIGYHIVGNRHITAPRRRRGAWVLALGALLPLFGSLLAGLIMQSVCACGIWLGLLCYFPLWEIFRTPLQQFALSGTDVDFIPRMDLKKVKDKPKTVVLVSTLLPKAAEAPALEKRLRQLYFSNSDPDMYYCILADFKEWDFPSDEKDESQIEAARKVVEGLNARYDDRFMIFLRGRVYNKTQKKYSGWERKRGAITEFIRFLKREKTSVHTFVGDEGVCESIRYIIALDSDTDLLYESAQTLVSAAIHPLNRPVVGESGIVTAGYGILAPKMSTDLNSAKRTAFSRILSGCGGVTAYDTRDKDFYQDLFGESIFAGKGLIDIDSFYAVLNDRFPENQILSHDILEGAYLRTGFVSDVEMTDSAPSNMTSWISRLHRWIRGDWQNILFFPRRFKSNGKVFGNPISPLSKYKLFDNLRRSFTPVASLSCIIAALFVPPRASLVLALSGVLAVTLSSVWAAVCALFTGGFFTLSRKFFTRTLPHTIELLVQALLFLIMLPAQAFSALDAISRSLWRVLFTRKKMLEWTTAAQGDIRKATVMAVAKRYLLPEIFGLAYLLLSSNGALLLIGVVFSLVMPVAHYTARPTNEEDRELGSSDRDTLISYNAAMWRYYEDFANAENNFLPPDNIQQSPVFRVANRTSPTNIGMMMLSVLAARDFDFIDTDGLYLRLERTLSSVERLKLWHGNLINWYDTTTLDTLKPEFVSTVDSGNFVCCLVALKEGLREFVPEKPQFTALIARVEEFIEKADLTKFYDKRKKLFSIGFDCEKECLVDSHYDFLMSEARLTSYFAVARKTVGKKHWGALTRTMSRNGSYAGAVSWTGTMFEYYMPHLLLPVYDGSLLGEALIYCLYCQKKRVRALDMPWGISESAFYAFDNNLNYQYKAHGVQKLGVKRYLDRELVISPYSTFITIPFNPNSSIANLKNLRELGVYGRYGFYEAVDFTAERVGTGALSVTRSYMAHHIGMSMVSSCNALFKNRMQERFMHDNYMNSAREFLQEKIAKNTVVFDELKQTEGKNEKHERPKIIEQTAAIYPQDPRCTLLTNGEITDILTDTGASYLKFGGVDLTRRSDDLLRRAQGLFALVKVGSDLISATLAPFYDAGIDYSMEQDEHSVTYFAKKKQLEVGMRCMIHPTISCEQRQIAVKNSSSAKKKMQILIYFEPILSAFNDYNAHPAYSKLFVTARYDPGSKTLVYTRRNRDSTSDMFLTVGFMQDLDFEFETVRENLMSSPNGFEDLRAFRDKSFSNNCGGIPDACCALRLEMTLGANSQQQATLLLAATRTEAEGIAAIISTRKSGAMESKNAAVSPLLGDSLEGRLGGSILGQLLFTRASCDENILSKTENIRGQSFLWQTGISGDLPIALLELDEDFDDLTPQCYIKLHSSLRSLAVEFDLCIIYASPLARERIASLVEKYSVTSILGARGGVFLLQASELSMELLTLLRATARHTMTDAVHNLPAFEYRPMRVKPVLSAALPEVSSENLAVSGGVFAENRFYCDRKTPLPFSHVLASPQFGTLVSDSALGYTWAINSRENKLTPWYNDICTDNCGELLLLRENDTCYDLVRGSRASFSQDDAVYRGFTESVESKVTVSVAGKGFAKFIDASLENLTDKPLELKLAYYAEPVLNVGRGTARHLDIRLSGGVLLMRNPYNASAAGFAAIHYAADCGAVFTTDRAAFLCGSWSGEPISPTNDPCAAVILSFTLNPREKSDFRFALTYGATEKAALFIPRNERTQKDSNSFKFETPDAHLNAYLNGFAPNQILASRIYGRAAFYQCGGAYGFRDQLQDVCAYLLIEPKIAKRHIVRCCSVQFEEGDVLHWWHRLPKSGAGIKGVRTLFSDDLAWLPLAVSEYIEKTGDDSILSHEAHYLSAETLAAHEHEKYISPGRSELREDVFSHCVRAIEKAHNLGENGLPLIGCGDWNDGFSSVGLGRRGTSVWLALFLSLVLVKFTEICGLRSETGLAAKYREWAGELKKAVDRVCWDGAWYVRAFYDNSERMGSRDSSECRIDLMPQSFSVFADMPDKTRVNTALNSALENLYDRELRLVKLFEKPFQRCRENPGYVKAYPAGIRENGGQYTHAAVWFGIALLEAGRINEGFEILQMLNPANRASFPELAEKYKLEPYYIAADIYTNPNAAGRGGWSVYTGAASWYFRAILEHVLGFKLCGDYVEIKPKIPSKWFKARLSADISGTSLDIEIRRGEASMTLCDGKSCDKIPLDEKSHTVEVIINN